MNSKLLSLTLKEVLECAVQFVDHCNKSNRWNIEKDDDDLLICDGTHERYEKCTFVRYRKVGPGA